MSLQRCGGMMIVINHCWSALLNTVMLLDVYQSVAGYLGPKAFAIPILTGYLADVKAVRIGIANALRFIFITLGHHFFNP